MTHASKRKPVLVYLDPLELAVLDDHAQLHGISRSAAMRTMVRRLIKELEKNGGFR